MNVEKEQFDKVMAELRRACMPAGGADAVQAYVDAQGLVLAQVMEELNTARRDLAGYKMGAKAEADAGDEARAQVRALKAQLAEVLYILDQHRAWTGMGWEQLPVPVHAVEKIRRKLAQAEQQEAQGAQAVDEDAAFLVWAEREYQTAPDEELNLKHVDVIQNRKGWMARAALATHPAVPVSTESMNFEYADLSGERRTVTITRDEVIEGMEDALYEKLGDQICRCEPVGETHVVDCNCQDYIEHFTLVKPHSSLPKGSVYAVRGAEHE